MTPAEIKEARRELGLTGAELASLLRLGKGGDRTVRRWESGEVKPGGPVIVALELLTNCLKSEEELKNGK